MSMKIYIAGPMRGKPHYNFPAFDAARDQWRADGFEVVSPADLDRDAGFDAMTLPAGSNWDSIPPGFDMLACHKRDLSALLDCNAVYLLAGWRDSVGAVAEVAVAEWAGIEIIEQTHESILDEALRITSGPRRRDYDAAGPNHARIADLWNAYTGIRIDCFAPLSAGDVAAMMILLKLARHVHTPKRDNCVDIAGYARCMAQIAEVD